MNPISTIHENNQDLFIIDIYEKRNHMQCICIMHVEWYMLLNNLSLSLSLSGSHSFCEYFCHIWFDIVILVFTTISFAAGGWHEYTK